MRAKAHSAKSLRRLRELNDLVSIGDATLRDFALLGIESLDELTERDPKKLYQELCKRKGSRLDPGVEDFLRSAIAQAKPKTTSGKRPSPSAKKVQKRPALRW